MNKIENSHLLRHPLLSRISRKFTLHTKDTSKQRITTFAQTENKSSNASITTRHLCSSHISTCTYTLNLRTSISDISTLTLHPPARRTNPPNLQLPRHRHYLPLPRHLQIPQVPPPQSPRDLAAGPLHPSLRVFHNRQYCRSIPQRSSGCFLWRFFVNKIWSWSGNRNGSCGRAVAVQTSY